MNHHALTVVRDPGGAMRLADPIPEQSVMGLSALTAAGLREWLLVTEHPAGDQLELCGHLFRVAGWVSTPWPGGLVLRHEGPAPPRRVAP